MIVLATVLILLGLTLAICAEQHTAADGGFSWLGWLESAQ